MISPEAWKESIENANTCKFIGTISGIKKEKTNEGCSVGNLYIKTKEGIYVKGNIFNGECEGGRFSFSKGNLPKVGKTYHFFVGIQKNGKENNVINAIKGKYSERTGLIDFSKIKDCEVSEVGKKEYETIKGESSNIYIFLIIFLIFFVIGYFLIKKFVFKKGLTNKKNGK